MSQSLPGRWRAWLQLVRPPNLVTVPGDPLAGVMVAAVNGQCFPAPTAIVGVMLSALLIYMGGLIFNDVADFEADSRERPSRPLPSGAVSRGAATAAGILATLGGIAVALLAGRTAVTVAAVLAGLVLVYSFALPRGSIAACGVMGACRGTSLLMGAAVLGHAGLSMRALQGGALGVALYVFGITRLAARETGGNSVGAIRWLPLGMLLASIALFTGLSPTLSVVTLLAFAAALCKAGAVSYQLGRKQEPKDIARSIGLLIGVLLWWQAALCAAHPRGEVLGLALVVIGHLLGRLLGRRFYAS